MKQIFESENIRFVEVSEELVKDYLVMVNDYENVNRFLGGKQKEYTEEQEKKWVQKKLEEKAPVFSLIDKNSEEFIGNIELMNVTDTQGELGIAITADKQEQGYGTEAVSALVKYGTDRLGLKKIVLRANPDNARAIRVYEKCGFREYDRNDEDVFMELIPKGSPVEDTPKTAVVYYSRHHFNTKKLLEAIAEKHELDLFDVLKEEDIDLSVYDRIGFASGAYYATFAVQLLSFAENRLPEGKDVFFINTCGTMHDLYFSEIRKTAKKKRCRELGSYQCLGFDTFGPFKLVGGIAKGHPDEQDIEKAIRFYESL